MGNVNVLVNGLQVVFRIIAGVYERQRMRSNRTGRISPQALNGVWQSTNVVFAATELGEWGVFVYGLVGHRPCFLPKYSNGPRTLRAVWLVGIGLRHGRPLGGVG